MRLYGIQMHVNRLVWSIEYIHTPYEQSLIERVNQYLKDRTEVFDDHYPCRKKGCSSSHVRRWLNLFCFMYNQMWDRVRFDGLLNLMEVSP